MVIYFYCSSALLCLVPLFYGASKGRFGHGVAWCLGSLIVPAVMAGISWGAIVAALRGGGAGAVAAGAGASMLFGAISLLSSFLVPAYGVSEIAKADKRSKALAATRRRPAGRGSKRRASGRINPGVGKAQRARSSSRVQAVDDQVEEPAREPCPRCAELVAVGAMICRFCDAKLRLSPEEVDEAEIAARLRDARKGLS